MRRIGLTVMLGFAVIATAVMPAVAQTPAQKPAFDVISVKVNKSGTFEGTTVGIRGSTFSAINATLRMLIQAAYQSSDGSLLSDDHIIGVPGWIDTDHFDVLAKPGGAPRSLSRDEVRLMVQSLLEDRFRLSAHQELRELPVYNLTVAKGGVKMKLSPDQSPPTGQTFMAFDSSDEPLPRGSMRTGISSSAVVLAGNSVPISRVMTVLQGRADRKVFDKTDLKGLFDFNVRFSSAGTDALAPADQTWISLFAAIEELGLKLESAKAPLEVVVIDSVQKPSEN